MSEDRTAEILKYVSAMARDFGEHRQEMKEFRQEFNQFREETNARVGSVEGRLGSMEGRLESLEEQFLIFKREQRQMSQLVSRVGSVLVATSIDVEELQDRMTLLEGKGS